MTLVVIIPSTTFILLVRLSVVRGLVQIHLGSKNKGQNENLGLLTSILMPYLLRTNQHGERSYSKKGGNTRTWGEIDTVCPCQGLNTIVHNNNNWSPFTYILILQ